MVEKAVLASVMLCVLRLLIGVQSAHADNPTGTYRLTVSANQSVYTAPGGKVLPSCGDKINAPLKRLRKLTIVYSTGVMVNDEDWILDSPEYSPELGNTSVAHSPDSTNDLYVQVHFTVIKGRAHGILSFSALEKPGKLRCVDSRELTGTFAAK